MMKLASTVWIIYPKFCGSSAHITSASIKCSWKTLENIRVICKVLQHRGPCINIKPATQKDWDHFQINFLPQTSFISRCQKPRNCLGILSARAWKHPQSNWCFWITVLVAISVDKFSLNLTILQSTSSSSCPVILSTHRISTSLSTPLSISTSRRRWYDSGDYLIRKMEGQNQLPQTPPSTIRTKICTMSLRQSTVASAMHVQEIRKLENLQDKVGGGCKPCTQSSTKGSSALCIIS